MANRNGGDDVVLLEDGERGDITEYYSAQSIPLALVIDHEGFVSQKKTQELHSMAGRVLTVL